MTETLTITVNNKEETLPADFGATPEEFVEALNYNPDKEWRVYRKGVWERGETLVGIDECEESMVVDDGDEFMVIPRYCTGGG